MRNAWIAALVLSGFSSIASPVSASTDPARILLYPATDKTKMAADELAILSDLLLGALRELPRDAYAATVEEPPAADPKGPCDAACLLADARAKGAAFHVAWDLKKVKKSGTVMTIALTAAADGQVLVSSVSEICQELSGLMEAARTAAAAMRDALAALVPAPEPAPAAVEPSAPAGPVEPPTGVLRVTSNPTGVRVDLFRSKEDPGQAVGSTPVEIPLPPWSYRVRMGLAGHLEHEELATVRAGETTTVNATMRVDEWPPLRIAAHATFWPGVAVGLFAGAAGYLGWRSANGYDESLDAGVAKQARTWTGVMWGAGGASAAILTTSLVLLLKLKKGPQRTAGAAVTMIGAVPARDGAGGALALGRRF